MMLNRMTYSQTRSSIKLAPAVQMLVLVGLLAWQHMAVTAAVAMQVILDR